MQVKNGDTVNVHYRGTFADGTEFDNSHSRGQALSFELGSGRMIPGFSNAVVGMAPGETKKITLSADQAYGPHRPTAIQKIPRTSFDPDFDFRIGGTIRGNGPLGPFLATIKEVANTEVTLDMNHPLAGEELNFEIEVLEIVEGE